MIVDTDKTNCGNCKFHKEVEVGLSVKYHPMMDSNNIGKLCACMCDNGFNITGESFYCTLWEKRK